MYDVNGNVTNIWSSNLNGVNRLMAILAAMIAATAPLGCADRKATAERAIRAQPGRIRWATGLLGKLVTTGGIISPDFPTTANAMQPSAPGIGTAFVTRLNPLGTPGQFLDYSTYLGGSGGDVAYDVAADSAGIIYVAGYTLSADFPVTPDAVQSRFGAGIEAFLVKLDPSVAGKGALRYGSYFGTTGMHVATGLAVAPDGSVFLGGYTTSSLQTTASAYQGSFGNGYTDGFVLAVK